MNPTKKTVLLPVISARRGSSLRSKNIWLNRDGVPLLAASVMKALALKGVRKTTVSVLTPVVVTDSENYANLAREAGADIVFSRNITKFADVTDNLRLAARSVRETNIVLMLLQCTSPDVSRETLSSAVDTAHYLDKKARDAVGISCVYEQKKWTGLFFVDKDKKGEYLTYLADPSRMVAPSVPRQKLAPAARFTGAVSVFHASLLSSHPRAKSFFDAAKRIIPIWHHTAREAIDIDTIDDALAAGCTPIG